MPFANITHQTNGAWLSLSQRRFNVDLRSAKESNVTFKVITRGNVFVKSRLLFSICTPSSLAKN